MRRLPLLILTVALIVGVACTDRSTPAPTASPPNISEIPTLRPYLTHRDRAATPMLSAFDFDQAPRPPDPLPLRTDCTGPVFPED